MKKYRFELIFEVEDEKGELTEMDLKEIEDAFISEIKDDSKFSNVKCKAVLIGE